MVLLSVVYGILELLFSKAQMALRRIVWPALAAGVLCVPLLIPVWYLQDKLTEQRAERIIQRLGTYQRQHGHYPDSLTQLARQQTLAVPTTANGLFRPRSFGYITATTGGWGAQGFRMQDYAGAMVEASYSSRSKQWSYED
ncbi:hypothetical protein [Hymenobacter koreensis]|uniref:Uncharacterized protein n=1 Tax=Hymenobacter koreensis TaxID=1084523 RepID=A0ABP8J9C1_9BACT